MKIIETSALALLLNFSFLNLLYAATEKPISLQISNLTRWKNSHEAPALRQSLGTILKKCGKSRQIIEPFDNVDKCTSIFKKNFLLLDAEPNDFGGFFALVVFKKYPKVFRAWIYEIDKNVFEVREMIPLRVTLNKAIMNELEDKRITPFWLTTLSP